MQDQIGRHITLKGSPDKIVSLVPSITELLFDLVPMNRIAGRTKFCIHPQEKIIDIPKVGGTKTIDLSKIKNISPDLILANLEENTKEQIEELYKDYPVYISNVKDIKSCISMINDVARLTNATQPATKIIKEIEQEFTLSKASKISCIYLIWNKPYMCAGNDTYISAMLSAAGFQNLLQESRYPEITIDQINTLQPEVILLSSEPFPFKDKHIDILKSNLSYAPIIKLVDGEMFSWYGSRTAPGLRYGKQLRKSI
jgi:ABC-type Fe3+-hydroxamate transport system substrate-binding protein